MNYEIVITSSARRELAALPPHIRKRVDKGILSLAENPNPRPPTIIPMRGKPKGLFRLRVGDYRVIFQVIQSTLVVAVIEIGHRREIYR